MNTLTDSQKTEIREALATWMGWTVLKKEDGWSPSTARDFMGKPDEDAIASPPNYPASLDACHAVELKLTGDQWTAYCRALEPMVRKEAEIQDWRQINPAWLIDALLIHAGPIQKSLALYRALNLGELGD